MSRKTSSHSTPANPQELFNLFARNAESRNADTNTAGPGARMGHWAWNPRDDSYYMDPGLTRLLGYADGELPDTGRELLDMLAGEGTPRILRALERFSRAQGADIELVCEVRIATGEKLGMLLHGQRMGKGPDAMIAGMALDTTGKRRARLKLMRERNQMYSLLDRLPVSMALIASDHTLQFANRAYRDLFPPTGEPPTCHRAQYGRDTPCEICPTFDVFETNTLTVWKSTIGNRHYEMYGYPFEDAEGERMALAIGIDLTQMYKAQRALRQSEERYRSITDNLAMGIAVLDRDFRITAANPKMRQWFGLSVNDRPLCHAVTRFRNADGPCADCPCQRTLEDGNIHETMFENCGPENRSYRIISCPIFDDAHRIVSLIEMVDDVTDKQLVHTRLQRAEKVQALGTLAGGLAHEINQPLNALHLYASGLEMLLEQERPPDRATLATRIGWIVEETEKIRQTINHMRVLASGGEAVVAPTDVNAAVMRALKLVSAQLEAHGTGLDLNLTPGLPFIAANPVQLEQVILNLVVNALHALDDQDGGQDWGREPQPPAPPQTRRDKRIVISSRLEIGDGMVSGGLVAPPPQGATPPANTDDQRVQLVVADNGPGLGKDAERIFDPFYTTKEAGRGMGLGLSLVHTFVSSWGGGVSARNRTDNGGEGGAEFTVRLRLLGDD